MNSIVACATGADPSALAVVRLSGCDAFEIASKLSAGHKFKRFRQLELILVSDSSGPLDRCLAVAFKGPRSFTGEDVVEFHLHGGPGLVEAVITACVAAGARRAEPGEYTRRAFLAGKLDLVEAEAIAARAGAATARAARLAEAGVAGRLSQFCRNIEVELTVLRAGIEAWLDFAPEELRAEDEAKLVERLEDCAKRLRKASDLAQRSLPLFEAPIVLLAGPVNAGKSSLFNALVGSDRALVSAEAGTTRDWIEVELALPAGRIRLRDSAGLRAASGAVEAAGIKRALALQNEADLVLWCLAPGQIDEPPEAALCLRTKADLDPSAQVSASTGAGIEELLQELSERLFRQVAADSETGVITSRRQMQLLSAAAERCFSALNAMNDSSLEFAASDLRGAAEALAELTGTQEPDELMLDALFSQFCLGK